MSTAEETVRAVRAESAPVSELLGYLEDSDAGCRRTASIALSEIAEANPDRLEGLETALLRFLDSEDPTVRNQVAAALATYVHVDPERGPPIASDVCDSLGDESPLVRRHTLSILRAAARCDPSTVEPAVEAVVDQLDADTAAIRQRAVAVLLLIGQANPRRLQGHEPALVARLDDHFDDPTAVDGYEPPLAMRAGNAEQDPLQRIREDEYLRASAIRQGVALLVATLSDTDPSGFEGLVPTLLDHVDDDQRVVRRSIVEALGRLGEAGMVDPDRAGDPLLERLEADPSDLVRGRAAWALAVLAERNDPLRERAVGRLASNLDLLEASDEEIRIGVTTLATALVESRPDAVRPAREQFETLRNDGSETVRRQAAFVLDALAD